MNFNTINAVPKIASYSATELKSCHPLIPLFRHSFIFILSIFLRYLFSLQIIIHQQNSFSI